MGNEEIVTALIKSGSPSSTIQLKWLAISGAVESGHIGIAKLLIRNGANVFGNPSPLKIAIRHKAAKIVRLLLAGGADVSCIDTNQHMTSVIRSLLEEWRVELLDVTVRGFYNIVPAARSRFDTLSDDCCKFVEFANSPRLFDDYFTPIMNKINEITIEMGRYCIELEQSVRLLRSVRMRLLRDQFSFLNIADDIDLISTTFKEDEHKWKQVLKHSFNILEPFSSLEPAGFPAATLEDLEAFHAQSLEATETRVFGQFDGQVTDPVRNRRGMLMSCNIAMSDLMSVISESYPVIESTSSVVVNLMGKIELEMEHMAKLLACQQQLNLEFLRLGVTAALPQDLESLLEERKGKVNLDRGLMQWEKKRFVDLSACLLRILRHCVN
jgi:hypothetical protein